MRGKKLVAFLLVICAISTILMVFQAKYSSDIVEHQKHHSESVDRWNEIGKIRETEHHNENREVENLPRVYFQKEKILNFGTNKSCAKFPDVFGIKFQNDHWQTQHTSNGTFQLLNAFLDDRELNPKGRTIRILAMFDSVKPNVTSYCQLWFDKKKEPVIVQTREYYFIWVKGWGGDKPGWYQPFMISCDLPKDLDKIPMSVSLVEKPCQNATNNLRVIYDKPNPVEGKKDFVVCVKGLDFPEDDLSLRLLEWIELIRSLGGDKIVFYEFSVHPNIKKLLNYYIEKGFVEVNPISVLDHVSNNPFLQNLYLKKLTVKRRLQEVMPYNDCFYRNMYKYKYVVILDTDEVVVPLRGKWKELIDPMEAKFGKDASCFDARNVYFLDSHLHKHEWFGDVPRYLHMLQHVYRAANYTKPGFYVKCFHRTAMVHTVHNHYPRSCLASCRHHQIDLNLGHLQHYRSDCVKGVGNCAALKAESVLDSRVWNFKSELIDRCTHVLQDLNYFL